MLPLNFLSPVTYISSFSPRTLRWIRPLFSVWSCPHRLGTLFSHRLWTFISQPHTNIQTEKNITLVILSLDFLLGSISLFLFSPFTYMNYWSCSKLGKKGNTYLCCLIRILCTCWTVHLLAVPSRIRQYPKLLGITVSTNKPHLFVARSLLIYKPIQKKYYTDIIPNHLADIRPSAIIQISSCRAFFPKLIRGYFIPFLLAASRCLCIFVSGTETKPKHIKWPLHSTFRRHTIQNWMQVKMSMQGKVSAKKPTPSQNEDRIWKENPCQSSIISLLQSERKYILALAIFLDPNQSGHIVTLKMIYPCFCLNHKQSLTGRAVFYSYTALSKQNKPAN